MYATSTRNSPVKYDVPMGEYDGTPIHGLPLAARYFFNKDLREVTPAEAAVLVGMMPFPPR